MQNILFNGEWTESSAPSSTFHAFNPSTKEELTERAFPESNWDEVESLVDAAFTAAQALLDVDSDTIASFLECYAAKIEAATDRLAAVANEETGLPVSPRLAGVEIPRTVNQIRQAAATARSGDWARPTLDNATNIHSMHGPLGGPVVVFGPNNFPFAYNGISGGDFASAIAAGNPVIAKAHPAHPYTTQLLAELAQEAVSETGLPAGTVQLFYGTAPENGLKLVSHSKVAAVGFTGSRPGGLALKEAADKAGTPIYLEMSSVNPVFVMPGALQERGSDIGTELHGSCTLGAGQFCTKPGLVVVQQSSEATALIEQMTESFSQSPAGILLTGGGVKAVSKAVEQLKAAGAKLLAGGKIADTAHFGYEPTLLTVDGSTFLGSPNELQSEAFGAVCLVAVAKDAEEMLAIASTIEGNLTGSIYSDTKGGDDSEYAALSKELRTKVGRLLNDKVPTGVAVCPAMNHGGPYPATGHPGFTAVGFPASVIRFSALHSYDNVRENRLPQALQKKNPTGSLNRLVDGKWTTADA
ncbi:aldehyde dehydrogenase (NADP(+)) [Pelagicoccus sp. SDUM812002]|uniref:aldehyde dehydrogenase (NADP(+)) n=1 Tax=Pelagicoccus sp. SDUM812002 TaxID=3041266 RepID=UPI00280F23D6|nr:aldehyde dehydrogenase (NADP(+)) [Pelagicoccus sp. SDUM812002]MDQ8183982.1 aldehyde dehydrogenase (NADP(+)) [Pelagicoccus sp. SDUM812002]